jgi:serine/threonine-protein kinase
VSQLSDRLTATLAGRYSGIELLGAGGMASVYRAHDVALERIVAIKVLPPDLAPEDKLISRFEQEAKLAAKLDHPNIIPIYRVESENGLHYFVMKFVPGKSLDALLANGRPLDVEFTLRVLIDAAAALGHAHQRGVVHRDVKPANIMIDTDERVILTDFGISKAMETASGITKTGIIVGTPHYMAPEQAMGSAVDGRADQYALACVGYHMLTGELPFPGDVAHSVLHRHIYEEAKPLAARRPDAPRAMVQAITRAMSKEPGARFATMEEFAASLEGNAHSPSTSRGGRSSRSGARARAIAPTVAAEAATGPVGNSGTNEYQQSLARSRRWRVVRWAGALAVVAVAGAVIARRQTAPAAAVPVPVAVQHDSTPPVTSAAASSDSARGSVAPPAAPPPAPKPVPPRATPGVRTASPKPAPPPNEAPYATLTIDSDPYGNVFVNGRPLGVSPVDHYRLAVGGTYEISVEREGYKTKKDTIRITRPIDIPKRYVLDPVKP